MAADKRETVLVTGPNVEGRKAPTAHSGISGAQYHANQHGAPGTWYVRVDDVVAYTVERHEDGSLTTRAAA